MAKIIILDTSYMLELFGVSLDSQPCRTEEARKLFQEAIQNGYDVFCPLSVLYELANYIVDIKDHNLQQEIAERFKEMVEGAFTVDNPFSIIPNGNSEPIYEELASLPKLCREYQGSIRMGLGLTDCTIIDVARMLKRNYATRKRNWPAHIWTTHAALKAMAPDDFGHQYF
ncbi:MULTISPECIES: hypothetical protein [unclassified Pseudomonas]|uniref:hypothetical protein n=1 Tax=unclassified Pseudomonas TaxID=196821 RepID=UPI0011B74B9F|nr:MULTISPECIES: hypothetical protein [unclassified Pseudomonas]